MQISYMRDGRNYDAEAIGAVGLHLRVARRDANGAVVQELVTRLQARDQDAWREAWEVFSQGKTRWQTDEGPIDPADIF